MRKRNTPFLLLGIVAGIIFFLLNACASVSAITENQEGKSVIVIRSYNQLIKRLKTPNRTYVIKRNIKLHGHTIKIPNNSVLLFSGGALSDGIIVGNNTRIAGKPRIGTELHGVFQNKEYYSSWFDNVSPITIAAIKTACRSNATFIIDDRRTIDETLYLFSKGNLRGGGGCLNFVSCSDNGVCILCGTDGKAPQLWSGIIDGVVINIKDYKYGIALCNVAHCSVINNTLNATTVPSYRGGKLISRFNNGNITHLSGTQTDITLSGNTLNMHGKKDGTESKASYESISVCDFTDNVRIVRNTINNSTDDVGIHSCTNILIEGNIISTEDGRIYCSDSRDVRIVNNTLGCYAKSMGIMITMESQNRICENILIEGNTVHPLGKNTLPYGVRVNNGKNIVIKDNQVEGQLHIGYQDFVIENRSNKPVQFSEKDLIIDYVTVKNNRFTQINGTGWNKTNNRPQQILFEDNVVTGPKFNVTNVHTVVCRRNAVYQRSNK